jgi:hypothetical protein
MTPLTAPTIQLTGTKTRPLDGFMSALARGNPFSHHRVTATGTQPVDVPSIHDAEFRTLTALAERASDQNEAVGAVVWGESGSGKSNLLRRLAEWSGDGRAVAVNFLELQAAPDRLHRAVLTAVVSSITNGLAPPWHRAPLYRLLEGLVRPVLPPGKQKLSPTKLEQLFRAQMAGPVAEAGGTPVVHATVELLFRFLSAALAEKSRQADGEVAAAAVRRLGGDALDGDEAKAAGVRPTDAADPLDPADCTRVLALLAQVARANGQPLILCFDQINSLPRQQIGEVARLLHELNDRLRNTLLVLSEVRTELLNLTDAGVISQATWDRLAANKVEMPRLTVPEGRRILEARLEQFLTQFEGEVDVKRHYTEDPLFPLGEKWFTGHFVSSVDVRPRRMIDAARDRWEELQKSLHAAPDKGKWLKQWPNFGRVDPPIKPIEQLIDEQVEKAVTGRLARHAAAPNGLPPNADNLCGLVESLLANGGVGLAVSLPKRGSPYDLLVRSPKPGGGETTAGLVFLATGSSNSVTSSLGRLAGEAKRPDRVVLVTDQRLPLAFGRAAKAQGRNYYAALNEAAGFEHLELPFSEYAALEALDTVARQASDLEIAAPGGPPRPLKRDEVIASCRRTGRLGKHPLLGRFVADAPQAATTLADAEVRAFVGGKVALTMGTDTHELARQFLNELSADRRAGLDVAACRARIEVVAKAMAGTGDVTLARLGDGYFLRPNRRPATS